MHARLTLDSLAAATPDRRDLFSDLTLSVGTERVGIVGRNGSGKSTLLRIVAGEAEPSAGSVRLDGSVGTLRQEWPEAWTVAEALGVAEGLAVLERILAGQGRPYDLDRAEWMLETRVAASLADAGMAGLDLERTIAALSGGERTRVGIARLLIEAPDVLLLDEPTNNLDGDGRAAIHQLLHNWRGGALVASHDRALLETMDRIVELTPLGVRVVGGGWSRFAELRDAERQAAEAELARSAAALRTAGLDTQRQREAKQRRDKAGRTFAAKASEPKILLDARAGRAEASGGRLDRLGERRLAEAEARLADAARQVEVITPIAMDIPPSGIPSGAQLVAMDGVSVELPGRALGPWTLAISGPERVSVGGPNGSGKSTLLKLAAGATAPTTGTVRRADSRIVMLDQHIGLLDRSSTLLANHRRLNPSMSENEAYAACARFGFRNRDALRPVGTLSGGERLRAGLACTLGGDVPPWLLILDEPTNHLDIESVALLEQALQNYDGALLVVSHDPRFLDAIAVGRAMSLGGVIQARRPVLRRKGGR
ncbi:MAG: ABC-F family ATP-binding cassette domain-containing protein [Rhizobiaceae bacterium]|nr:ABC-F family ATP-binding cassette domain-containing protein [Rhizobiaceae bacterium]